MSRSLTEVQDAIAGLDGWEEYSHSSESQCWVVVGQVDVFLPPSSLLISALQDPIQLRSLVFGRKQR